jgi:hypothetical protein
MRPFQAFKGIFGRNEFVRIGLARRDHDEVQTVRGRVARSGSV